MKKHTSQKSSQLYIFGKKPVVEVLQSQPEIVAQIYVLGSVQQVGMEGLRELAKEQRIPLNGVSEKKLEDMAGRDANHQGIVMQLKHFPYADFDEWLGGLDMESNPAVLILDEVQDPHNVGAIIRTAAAAGMAGVLLPEHRQAPVTGTVFKTSAGAVMHIPVVRVGNVNTAVEKLKAARFWIYGIVQDGQTDLFEYVHDSAAAFIVGSEGGGIRELTRKHCDLTINIPMHESVESLNASVSAALVAYEWKRKSL